MVSVASFLFAAALTIQLPQVQTYIAERVMGTLTEKLDGDITFEKIHLKPFTTLVLKNITITDREPFKDSVDSTSVLIDTLFSAEYVIAKFTLDGLVSHEGFHLDRVYVENAQMNLVIEDQRNPESRRRITDNITRIFRIKPPDPSKKSEKEIFRIRKVEINNMGFAMKEYTSDRPVYPEGGIDWNDLDVKDINLSARNLRYKGGIMSGDADRLSFREKSGYLVEKMSGSARVGRGKTIIEDLHIDDPWSDVHLKTFMMSYKNIRAFNDFIEEVKLDGDISESILDFKTLSYFSPNLAGNNLKLEVSGKMSGCVDDFAFTDIKVNSTSGGFSGQADGRLTGIPYIQNTYVNATLKDFNVTSEGLGHFLSQWMPEDKDLDISRYAEGTVFRLNAYSNGMMNRLNIRADISSALGKAHADVRIDNMINPHRPIGISGSLSTEDLDAGKIIGTEMVGPVTLKTSVCAKLSEGKKWPEVAIDTLKIDRLYANGYDYNSITAVGDISSDSFNGKIVCHDPNLNFLFQGTFALSAKTNNARYQFYTNIGHADLHAINLDKRDISKVNLRARADFTKASSGDIRGKIDIGDINLQNSTGKYEIGDINLSSYSSDDIYTMSMDSKFAHGKYSGSAPVTDFVKDLRDITLKKELPALYSDSTYVWRGNSYNVDFRFYNTMDLLSFVMPGLYIDEGTALSASLDRKGNFSAVLNSNRLAFEKNYLKGIKADLSNSDNALNAELKCGEVKLASVSLKDSQINLRGEDNHIGLKFDYDNASESVNKGEIILHSTLSRDNDSLAVAVTLLPSSVFVNSKEWNMEQSDLSWTKGTLDVKSLAISSGNERISINGKASQEKADTLNLRLDRFDLTAINSLIHKEFGISGAASGMVQMTSPLKKKGILADMICDSTFFAGEPIGTLRLGSRWDENNHNFRIMVRNENEGQTNISAYGTFAPEGSKVNVVADLEKFSVKYAQPILTDVFNEMEGSITGSIYLNGPLSDMAVSSKDARLEDGLLRIAYTNVPYHAEGPFHLDGTGVYFDNISIRDDYTGTGTVSGSINWNNFRDMSFNTSILVNEIEGVNLPEDNGSGFYGRLFATGNVSLTGPMNSIVLAVDAVTAKDGSLHIPVSSTAAAGKVTNLLRFTEEQTEVKIDPYEAMMRRIDESENADSDFTVKLRVNAQQQVEVFVEIDKDAGNVLNARGTGLIDIEADAENFSINGDYLLTSGNFKFVAMGLVRKEFQIQDGSSIRFNGDIMNSDLDINAIYRTKASLSTLLSDESSVSNKRNVDCGINITGKLSNPQLDFSIEIPDLNPMMQSRVESALSTEDKVQKQFLSLIVSNNFLPDEQSGIVNNSSALYSNMTEILANQLNNILLKLDIPIDLGLNYQPNESGNDLFDVAVSTQLFNNRVVVNGNIGNKQYSTSGSQNDVVGDLDIEIKLDRSGSFRVNLFSHSADQFSNYLDNTQRNGVGLMYQTEFNSFGQFLKNIFMKKSKRREVKMQEEQAMIQSKKRTIRIEAAENKKTYDKQ